MSVSAWIGLRRVFPVVAACVSLTSASIAHAASEDWPQFWRGRSSPETSALLDEVYASTTGCGGIVAMCERAIVELQNLLDGAGTVERAKPVGKERSLPGLEFLLVILSSLEEQYRAKGQSAQMLPLSQRSLEISEKILGPEHPAVVASLKTLAMAYRDNGQYSQALLVCQRSLAIGEKVFGPEHPNVAGILNDLALLYQIKGQYAQVIALYQRSLSIYQKALGPENLYVATSLNNFAFFYKNAGQYSQALPLYQRSLGIREKILGPEHPTVAASLNGLAELYLTTGEYAKALPLSQRSLAIFEEVFGPEHPDVATSLNCLAILHQAMGQYVQALPLSERSLAIYEKVFGPEHPYVATSLNNLATLHKTRGQYAQALPLFERSLSVYEKAFGFEHPDVAKSLNNLGELYRETAQYAQALPLYQRSIEIYEKSFGHEHPNVAMSVGNLASLYQDTGQYAQALPLFQRGLALLESAVGHQHPDVATTLNNLAGLYKSTGQYAKALPLYQRSLEINEKVFGLDHPNVAASLSNLASFYQETGQYMEALSRYQRSLSIREKAFGSEHPNVALSLNNLAVLYQAAGQYAQALPLHQRSLAIYEKALGHEHPNVALSLNNLSWSYQETGQYEKASLLSQRSLAVYEKTLGPEHPNFAMSLSNLAGLYQRTGEYERALSLFSQAEKISVTGGAVEIAWKAQGSLQRINIGQGYSGLASFWGKRAINTIQGVRAGLVNLDRDMQKGFLRDKKTVYRDLTDLLIDQGRLAEAQQVLSMLKEEERLDYLKGNADKDPRAMRLVYSKFERPWVERYERESTALGKLGMEYQSLKRINVQVRTPGQIEQIDLVHSKLARAQKRYEEFIEELKDAFTREVNPVVELDLEDAEQLQGLQRQLASLGQGAVAVQYLVTEKRVRILVTTSQGILHRDSAITEKDLNASVNRYRQVLENPKLDPFADAQNLYKHLLEPIEADLRKANARLLMVSFDGRLRYLPIAALHDGKQWVAEKYAVAIYTPVTRGNLRQQPSAQWRVAGFGVSDGGDGMNPLTYVPFELEDIIRRNGADKNGVVAGEIYLNGQVREDVLAQVIQQQSYPVLHIASHFKFTLGGTLADSYLLLGQGKRLTLEQFSLPRFAMKGVDLLVLSACQTAMEGATQDGREIEGFGNLAQAQGAQAVLATQWSVNDQSTAQLMREFYAQREAKQLTKAEALQKAQLSLVQGHTGAVTASDARQPAEQRGQPIRDGVLAQAAFTPSATAPYAHPYYWAPFILMGNWL